MLCKLLILKANKQQVVQGRTANTVGCSGHSTQALLMASQEFFEMRAFCFSILQELSILLRDSALIHM